MPSRARHAERLRRLERFYRGCREALDALRQSAPLTDVEHNALARKLGRPDLVRDPTTPDLFPDESPGLAGRSACSAWS